MDGESACLVFGARELLSHYTIIVKRERKSSDDPTRRKVIEKSSAKWITPPEARLSKSQIDYANQARVAIERNNRNFVVVSEK